MRIFLAAIPLTLASVTAAAETTVAQFESNLWNATADSGDGVFVNAVRTVGDGGRPITYVAYADFDLVWHDDAHFTATGVFAYGDLADTALVASARSARLEVGAGALYTELTVYECTFAEGDGFPTCDVSSTSGTSPAIALEWTAAADAVSREVGTITYGEWPVRTTLSGSVTETDTSVSGTIGGDAVALAGHIGTLHRAWVSITRD